MSSLFYSALVLFGNFYKDLILFGEWVFGGNLVSSDIAFNNNIFINTFTSLTGLEFPYQVSLFNSVDLIKSVFNGSISYSDWFSSIQANLTSYGWLNFAVNFALSIGVVYMALKMISKLARIFKDMLNPLN